MEYLYDFIFAIISGIISGAISSYFFLNWYLNRKRPKIGISNYISIETIEGKKNYHFKFVNFTETEIFDVNIELTLFKPIGEFNGKNLKSTDIKLKDNFIAYVPCEKENDDYNLHAMRLRTEDDLEDLWKDTSSFLRISIVAKHALSGMSKVISHDFLSIECITNNKFISGSNLEIN